MIIGNYKIVNKVRFIIFVVTTIIFMSGLIVGISNLIIEEDYTYSKWEDLRIQKGDTLWKIAKNNNPFKENTQKVVYKIMRFNNMEEASIKAGDIIKIPVN